MRQKSSWLPILCCSLLLISCFITAEDRADPSAVVGVEFSGDGKTLVKFPHYHKGAYSIPSGVTSIGDFAFAGCIQLTAVIFPDSVTSIGSNAFNGCYDLSSISIPPSVMTIGEEAFSKTGIASLVIPGNGVRIGERVASGCKVLVSADARHAVTVGKGAFYYCSALRSVYLPSNAEYTEMYIPHGATITLCSETGSTVVPSCYGYLLWVKPEDGLRVRDEPGLQGNKITTLRFCTPVDVLETRPETMTIDGAEGHWQRIRSGKTEGWVFGGFLTEWKPVSVSDGRRLTVRNTVSPKAIVKGTSLDPHMIEGNWFVVYSDGKPYSGSGLGAEKYDCYFPSVGDLGVLYGFGRDGSCMIGLGHSGACRSGNFSLKGNTADCVFTSFGDGEDSDESIHNESYELCYVDKTHLQIRDKASGQWDLCALYDDTLDSLLKDKAYSKFVEYLKKNGYEKCTFASEESLLMIAVRKNNFDAVSWLVSSCGADVNQKNIYGMTPLHYAMQADLGKDSLSIVKKLLANGADPNAVDDYGQTPLDYTISGDYRSPTLPELRKALAMAGGKFSQKQMADDMSERDFVSME